MGDSKTGGASPRPQAKVTQLGDQDGNSRRMRIEWPAHGETNMVEHKGEFTVTFKTAGRIRREMEQSDGTIRTEELDVVPGVAYARPAGVKQRVVNLSGHAMDADKDEKRRGGNVNPDDTKGTKGG